MDFPCTALSATESPGHRGDADPTFHEHPSECIRILDGFKIAVRERCTRRHVSNTIPLACLAPALVRAVIDARLPRGINTKRIAEPALEWSRQWEMLGISA